MLIIRARQMEVMLEQQRLEVVLQHAQKFFPNQCSTLQPEGLERTVLSAMKRARANGFSAMRDMLQFVDLVLLLGSDFDSTLPWARKILEDRSGEKAHSRSTRLYLRALRHLRRNS